MGVDNLFTTAHPLCAFFDYWRFRKKKLLNNNNKKIKPLTILNNVTNSESIKKAK